MRPKETIIIHMEREVWCCAGCLYYNTSYDYENRRPRDRCDAKGGPEYIDEEEAHQKIHPDCPFRLAE